ncbi:MAG: hypothetical protein RL662_863 [Bacteroidota bacterium]|jgi:DNA-binding MarR family transcriptional regulator
MNSICQLKDIYKALYTFEKEFSEKNGITINEGLVLCCLKDGESKSANELCEFIGLSNSRVSRIINTIEKKELIARNIGNKDKRQMFFALTDAGKHKIQEMLSSEINFSELAKYGIKIV